MNAETKHGGAVDVMAVLRKASRSVPNDDFVAFDDALGALAGLIDSSARVIRAFEAYGKAHGLVDDNRCRRECEVAMVAQKEALANVGHKS